MKFCGLEFYEAQTMRSKISFSAEIYGVINPRDKILRNRISKMRNAEFYGLRLKILKFSK
ncbi:hypothetical protein [uncultured Campylobacter sp.]|uniref:hypothetical protein n=1 Tax=uncultured Campylobacter sp. TaxID=218934 RepID=UPI0026053863|nr:hypothetical protein [uncultured Campylobacter sp.]